MNPLLADALFHLRVGWSRIVDRYINWRRKR